MYAMCNVCMWHAYPYIMYVISACMWHVCLPSKHGCNPFVLEIHACYMKHACTLIYQHAC